MPSTFFRTKDRKIFAGKKRKSEKKKCCDHHQPSHTHHDVTPGRDKLAMFDDVLVWRLCVPGSHPCWLGPFEGSEAPRHTPRSGDVDVPTSVCTNYPPTLSHTQLPLINPPTPSSTQLPPLTHPATPSSTHLPPHQPNYPLLHIQLPPHRPNYPLTLPATLSLT